MATTSILSNPWSSEKMSQQEDSDLGLSEYALKIARKELREDKNGRDQSLQQLRDWIKKNQDVQDIRLDDRFLLRFLRVKKFSVPMAQQLLLKYLNLKKQFPHMSSNLDFLSPSLNDVITQGYCFVSPIRDREGRRVIIYCAKKFNPSVHTCVDMIKAHLITYETLMEDPENQVVGFVHVGDTSGMSAAHVTAWNPTEFAKIIKWGEQSIPMRHKEIHLVNVPNTVKYVIDFAMGRVSIKIKERFIIHTNQQELHKKVDVAALPKELGGTIPMAEMIDMWKRELASKRDIMMALDKMKILSDKGIIRRDSNNNNNTSPGDSISGSFRKLEVD